MTDPGYPAADSYFLISALTEYPADYRLSIWNMHEM